MMRARMPIRLCGLVVLALCAGGLAPAREAEKQTGKAEKAAEPEIKILFHEEAKMATMRFGILLPKLKVLKSQESPLGVKQLTYHPVGLTSNTCVKIDGEERLFGSAPGKWVQRKAGLGKDAQGKERQGARSVWLYPEEKVCITQTVEVVRGDQTGNVDTCRVQYLIENKDEEEHDVGLRFLLDTLVGTNDGAPFIIPGDRALCETDRDYKGADKVPPFAQALERLDFKGPGVVAHLQLKVPGLEPPARVTLGAWPNPDSVKVPAAKGHLTLWNVPVASIKQTQDSAAVLYWAEKKLDAGGKREVGFTYGLGNFASDKSGRLGVILGGPFQAGGELIVLALVKAPQEGQTVTLKLPADFELVKGQKETQEVPRPQGAGSDVAPVTWTVRTPRAGVFAFRVESSNGAAHRQGVRINPRAGAEKSQGDE
jgi:hypothetical protein